MKIVIILYILELYHNVFQDLILQLVLIYRIFQIFFLKIYFDNYYQNISLQFQIYELIYQNIVLYLINYYHQLK